VRVFLLLLVACNGAKPAGDDSGAGTSAWGIEERPVNETCLAQDRPPSGADVRFTRIYTDLDFSVPVAMVHAPGDDAWWYVLEQGGRIRRVSADPAATSYTTALDISDRVSSWSGNEDGLLGMDFHPDFASNGDIYVNYTAGSGSTGHSVVARFHSDDGGLTFDPDSESILLEIDQPYTNHNGGHVLFGPDGYLYLGFGDGGSAGDPSENGQNTDVLLAKMLRIDVDSGDPYGIPADNPFADGVDGRPEIYAWGMRNPWRYSFDRETGQLWVGDVGQDEWEEVDLLEVGGNYGWNEKEGTHCYDHRECEGPYIDPVAEYSHSEGDSITGGVVYRGTAVPSLVGTYLYADAYQGKVWGLFFDEDGIAAPELLDTLSGFPVHFAEAVDGEVYIVDYAEGHIFRMDPAGEPEPDTFPRVLSETGCVDPDDPTKPAPGMIPYGVQNPLWSDGADKSRWFAIPDGTTVGVNADGTFAFPVGSVTMKEFSFGDTRVETRLMMLHDDGSWAGYTYQWNETGTDADLLPADKTVEVEGHTWTFPSRSQCLQCHTAAANRVLGLRVEQLNGLFTYPGGATANQMSTLDHIGVLDATFDPAGMADGWPTRDGDAPVEDRARAYLASNCAMCHVPDGTGGGAMDYRYEVSFADTHTCGEIPVNGDLGVTDAQILAPGDPASSVLSLRMHALDAHRMPPVGTAVVDEDGVATIDEWIEGITSCP
jgi:uncharacterized repeat protein (TIGR03806 family)